MNKIPLFSKDLITFILSFISLFLKVIPDAVINEIPVLIFLPIIWSLVSRKSLLSIYLQSLFFNSFANEFFIEFTDNIISLSGDLNILVRPNRNRPNCTILGNRIFENFISADESFAKLYEFVKLVYQLMIIYVKN